MHQSINSVDGFQTYKRVQQWLYLIDITETKEDDLPNSKELYTNNTFERQTRKEDQVR